MPKETRTYKDRAKYLSLAVTKRRRRLEEMAIEYKGGNCTFCGYSKYSGGLDLHHVDPSKKNFSLSVKGLTRSWEKIKEELDKCVLVCANCHREIHAGLINIS